MTTLINPNSDFSPNTNPHQPHQSQTSYISLGLPTVIVGADVNQVFPTVTDFQHLSTMFNDDQYIFNMHAQKHPNQKSKRNAIWGSSTPLPPTGYLLLKDNATKQDLLRGLIFSFVVRQLWFDASKSNIKNNTTNNNTTTNSSTSSSDSSTLPNPLDTWALFHRPEHSYPNHVSTHTCYTTVTQFH